jgi:group I intron endonuclease
MYKLYKITNTANNKLYIGITKLAINDRFNKHKRDAQSPLYPLHCAMQKYGIEHFGIELLEESDNRMYIASKEQPTIELYNSHISKYGYNVALGGYGGNLGMLANAKRRKTMLNFSADKKTAISRQLSESHIGLKRTEDEKLKMSLLQRERGGCGPKQHSDETRNKISESNSGKIRNETARQNYRNVAILRGTGPQLQGKKISCVCCKKEWDLGNYTQHIKRIIK